jgi:hypothetical protein
MHSNPPTFAILVAFSLQTLGCGEHKVRSQHPEASLGTVTSVPTSAPSLAMSASAIAIAAAPLPTSISLADPKVELWMDARLAAAKGGKVERVRMPIVRKGKGWACACPNDYPGQGSASNPLNLWLKLTLPKGMRPLAAGQMILAEGTFGQSREHVVAGTEQYDLYPFTILRSKPMQSGEDEGSHPMELVAE